MGPVEFVVVDADRLCDSVCEAVREGAASLEAVAGLGRACLVHCLAAELAACTTGRILMSVEE